MLVGRKCTRMNKVLDIYIMEHYRAVKMNKLSLDKSQNAT